MEPSPSARSYDVVPPRSIDNVSSMTVPCVLAGERVPAVVDFLNYIHHVIEVIRRPASGALLNPPPERVILEAHGSPRTRQYHTGQPVLVIPVVGCRAPGNHLRLGVPVVVVRVGSARS